MFINKVNIDSVFLIFSTSFINTLSLNKNKRLLGKTIPCGTNT